MRKNFGSKPWVYPQPVLMIGTYDVEGREWTFDDDGYTDYDGWEQP